MDKDTDDKKRRLNALDSKTCAIRFVSARELVPAGQGKVAMNQQFMCAIAKYQQET